MISIEKLWQYYKNDRVFITAHAAESCRQRGITSLDIRLAVMDGEIIEQYTEDLPFPSCLILGKDENGRRLHICMSDEGSASRIITAYIPSHDKWEQDFKTRRGETK